MALLVVDTSPAGALNLGRVHPECTTLWAQRGAPNCGEILRPRGVALSIQHQGGTPLRAIRTEELAANPENE